VLTQVRRDVTKRVRTVAKLSPGRGRRQLPD